MRTTKVITSLLGTTVLISLALPYDTHAEVADTKDAAATFQLIGPTSNTLKITNATDLVFDDATIAVGDSITQTTSGAAVTISEISGTAPGWTLKASLGDFTDGTKTISGAQLFYPVATMSTDTVNPPAGIEPNSATGDTAFTGGLSGTIITGGATAVADTIVSAKVGNGYGNWTMAYDNANKIQLKIPAGHLAGNYTGTLTYTLEDTPGL